MLPLLFPPSFLFFLLQKGVYKNVVAAAIRNFLCRSAYWYLSCCHITTSLCAFPLIVKGKKNQAEGVREKKPEENMLG